jgi:hypothetical protein
MRVIARIGVRLEDVGRGTFDQLVSIHPSGIRRPDAIVFEAALPVNDAKVDRIRAMLASAGHEPWEDTSRRRSAVEYWFGLRRHYDESDLQTARLLELGFTFDHPPMKCEDRNDRGELILKRYPNRDITYAISSCFTVITDEVRHAMEAEGLAADAIFLPTERNERPNMPVWELRSSRTLPPVSPLMTLTEKDGTPFQGNYERVCVRREGLFHLVAELHYRAEDIAAMGPFDLAHTKERFGECPFDEYRPLVVSARFYDMCRRHKFKGGFTPVRIDP